ncbi:hypothetical protein G6O69_33455 [Pseudenhygromyxa sp. WMMC2535]|uniref:hypothetical protein n=1 Tax=Pseudenhygromyxa sp. WMMC2535 TaxID=2712867 RepID=UPI0015552C56|nr:hypothetical protein [Pseudenhygromyxa sp. WMMC2535]NVB42777.1 hypothetical protein [Pseudenhygromyxa sp. WMMC2535]
MDDELLRRLGRYQREALESEPAREELPEPLAGEARARLLDDVFARLETESPETETETEAPEAEVVMAETPEPTSSSPPRSKSEAGEADGGVVELRARSRRSLHFMGPALAAAAGLLLWWGVRSDPGQEVAALPRYELSRFEGGVASTRGAAEVQASLRLRPDDAIDWVFTPAQPIHGPVAVAIAAESSAGEQRFAGPVDAEISPEGAIRLHGGLDGFVALDAGEWRVQVLVATPGLLPEKFVAEEAQGAWQRIVVGVKIEPF